MTDLPPARTLLSKAPAAHHGQVVLGYDERLLRRKRLVTAAGEGFLVDLPAVTNLDDFWGFELEDGRAIQVVPATEALVEVTGPDLPRLAWHIGNRHTPCQIEASRLLIRRDHVLEAMLAQLGASVAYVNEPFTPEGGAYGTGRTMGHAHGPETPSENFGWHDHGDGNLHFHAPKR
ncbi:urease accessory protein UreE [bacterium]|nr:urease accessory protein UreE [bacterium]